MHATLRLETAGADRSALGNRANRFPVPDKSREFHRPRFAMRVSFGAG